MPESPLGPYNVHRLHPGSLKEEESLTVHWRNGRLTVTHVRSERPDSAEVHIEQWDVDCPKPRVTSRRYPSANLQQVLDDLEHGGGA